MSWQSTTTLQAGSSYGNGNQGFDNAWNAYLGTSSGYSSSANVSFNAARCQRVNPNKKVMWVGTGRSSTNGWS